MMRTNLLPEEVVKKPPFRLHAPRCGWHKCTLHRQHGLITVDGSGTQHKKSRWGWQGWQGLGRRQCWGCVAFNAHGIARVSICHDGTTVFVLVNDIFYSAGGTCISQ